MARPARYQREIMLQRALDLFWVKGYEATTVQDLLTGLDIHRGTLYDSFKDKHGLYMEVLAYYQQTIGKQLVTKLTQSGSKKAAIQQLFDLLTKSLASKEGQRGCMITNAAMELSLSDAEVATVAGNSHTNLVAVFKRALTEAQQAGELNVRSSEELQSLAQFLVATIQGLRVVARTTSELTELRQIANIALAVLD